MKKEIFDKYNIDFSEIREKIEDTIIEVVGEEYRAQVSNNLDRVRLNTYFSLEDIKRNIEAKRSDKKRELALKFLENIDIPQVFSEGEKKKLRIDPLEYKKSLTDHSKDILSSFFDDISLGFSELEHSPIYNFGNIIPDDSTEWSKNNKIKKECAVLNALGLNISLENYEEVINKEENRDVISTALKLKNLSLELREEYFEFNKQFQMEEEYFKYCEKYKNDMEFSLKKEFYKEILPYVDDKTKENIEKAFSEYENYSYKFFDTADKENIYLGYSIKNPGLIESFSKESENTLEGKDEYLSMQINKKRDKYYEYIKQNGGVVENPSFENIDKIEEIRKSKQIKLEEEIYKRTSSYENNIEMINRQNLLGKDEYCYELAKENVICCCHNISKNEVGKEDLAILMHIPFYDLLPDYKDVIFVHEIMHACEYSYKKIDSSTYEFKTGFETFLKDYENEEKEFVSNEEKRETELFSENIHQIRAIEVVEKLHQKGIYLFDNPLTAKERSSTSYERFTFLTSEFYNQNSKVINDARFSDSLEGLYNKIGKENFYDLNDVINEYATIPMYNLSRDLMNGEKTLLTEKREELILRSNKAVENIKQRDKEQEDDICI